MITVALFVLIKALLYAQVFSLVPRLHLPAMQVRLSNCIVRSLRRTWLCVMFHDCFLFHPAAQNYPEVDVSDIDSTPLGM